MGKELLLDMLKSRLDEIADKAFDTADADLLSLKIKY